MPQVFFSYAREDVAVAKLMKTGLQAAGYTVTLDIDDFTRGDWAAQIAARLQAADDVVVFLSPASLASENVGDEVQQALGLGRPLVPVLLSEPPRELPDWASALLRNQAARYDALDYEVSLARILKLLSARPGVGAGPAPGAKRWLGVGAASAIALGLAAWWWAVGRPSQGEVEPGVVPASSSAPAQELKPGRLRIEFKGAIRREQVNALETRLREVGFDVTRSERSEAVDGNHVVLGDARSAALAERVRVLAQAHMDGLGCRLVSPLQLRTVIQPVLPPGDLRLSLSGSCP